MTVLTLIPRWWRFLSYVIHARKTWALPRQCDLLIYDACNHDILLTYLRPWNPEVLHVRGEQVNVRLLFASLFRRGRRLDAYIDCFIETVGPRLIVTFIDNNLIFLSLAVRHPNIKTMFIQNGYRSYYLDVFGALDTETPSRGLRKVDCMGVFGTRVGAEYARYVQGTVVPMGDLINNMVPRTCATKRRSLGYISQFRNVAGLSIGGRHVTRKEFWGDVDRLVLSALWKYAEENGKNLVIIPTIILSKTAYSLDDVRRERQYYSDLLGRSIEFVEGTHRFACYDAVDSAEVVVGIDSTLVYESAARGNKTAFFSIRGQLLGLTGMTFGWPERYPEEGPFWTNRPDPAAFRRVLDHLFSIDDAAWQDELSRHGFPDIMSYDPGNRILQSVLQQELGPAPGAQV